MFCQHTLAQSIQIKGIGLHTGQQITMTLEPAPPDQGIVFRRLDLQPAVDIAVSAWAVGDTLLATTLTGQDGQTRVKTVEHLLSTLAGLGIDNLTVGLSTSEVPIMDGSAAPFVDLIQTAGIQPQPAVKRFIRVKEPVSVQSQDKWARLEPMEAAQLCFAIDFDHPAVRASDQYIEFDLSTQAFMHDISRARTFGFMRDIEYLHSHNLAQGGSLDNVVVLGDEEVVNADGLRYENEFVRHKILDALGDLYMLGHAVIGRYVGHKSGHALNNQLVRTLWERPEAWEYVTYTKQGVPVDYALPESSLAG